MIDKLSKLLEREKVWHAENKELFKINDDHHNGFIDGIDYCLMFINQIKDMSEQDETSLKRAEEFFAGKRKAYSQDELDKMLGESGDK